jgi:hypothetical protein
MCALQKHRNNNAYTSIVSFKNPTTYFISKESSGDGRLVHWLQGPQLCTEYSHEDGKKVTIKSKVITDYKSLLSLAPR